MADQEVQAAREIVAQLYPELTERMDTIYEKDPEELRRILQRRFPRIRFLVHLKDKNPALYELRIQDIRLGRESSALAKQVKQAHLDDDKARYKTLYKELEDKLTQHFDVKQRLRQQEIEALRQRVEQLEDQLEQQDDDRKDIIEQRLGELVGPEW